MTPSSRVGRRLALAVSFSVIAASTAALVTESHAAPVARGPFHTNAVNTGVSGQSRQIWTRPQGARLNSVSPIVLRRDPRSSAVHHLGLPQRHVRRGYGPSYLTPVTAPPRPQVTTVVQTPAYVQPAPDVVTYQPACVSPLIISIEPHTSNERRGPLADSARIVRGTSSSCLPDRITVRTGEAKRVSVRF